MTVTLTEHTVLRNTLKVFVIPKAKRLGESAVKSMTHHNDDLKLSSIVRKNFIEANSSVYMLCVVV